MLAIESVTKYKIGIPLRSENPLTSAVPTFSGFQGQDVICTKHLKISINAGQIQQDKGKLVHVTH